MNIRIAALAAAFALVASAFGVVPAVAQDKIDKPVKILVGFAPGGTADIIARVVADKMGAASARPVIVENKPGAIGRITAEAVKSRAHRMAPPIMVMPIGPMAVVPHVYKDITYDPIKDFTPIAIGATFQFAFAASPEERRQDVAGIRRSGRRRIRARPTTRRPAPAACRTSSACCSAAASASRWCTCRTRARPRT